MKKTFGILLIINVLSICFFQNWKEWMLTNGDSYGYYTYLPMTFIHHDFKTLQLETYHRTKNTIDHKNENYTPETMPAHWQMGIVAPNGNRVNIYTSGVALMQLPFFTLAHISAKLFGFSADGYSLPYRFILLLGNLFYVTLGLWFLGKILFKELLLSEWTPLEERGYSNNSKNHLAIGLTMISVMFATNLYYFTAFNGYMSHSHLFCLVSILMFLTIKFHENPQNKHLIGIGFIGGLITLIRPSDGLFLLIPLLYKITSWQTFLEKLSLFWSKKRGFLGGTIAFVLPFLPQLFYWKHVTDQWFFNSYGEYFRFDFANPHILEGLIGFKNGWLVYTPIMFFSLLGIFMMKGRKRDFLLPIAVFLPIYIYVIYSWWCYNYINGFGSRPMIEAYPLLAIPLSIFTEKMLKTKVLTAFFTLLLVFLIGLNVFQTWQMSQRILISEDSNAAFWLESFGKTTLNYKALVAFDSNEKQPKQTVLIKKLYENNFETPSVSDSNFVKQPIAAGQWAYCVPADAFSSGFKTQAKQLQRGRYVKIKLKAYSVKNSIWDIYKKSILVVEFRRGDKELKWRGMRIENKIGDTTQIFGGKAQVWGDIEFYVEIPQDILPEDVLNTYVWNQNEYALVIDDFTVELHK
ncbi:MAG: hypothetical protein JNL70_03400 [Saprospiraceae bacterium]|nr:hypothetical protein [Saprospiraceae bacterium]